MQSTIGIQSKGKARKVYDFLVCFIFVLFINSGTLKWINGWPVDATVLFGLLCVLILLFKVVNNKSSKIEIPVSIQIFLLLFVWILLSCIYSPSQSYYLDKLSRTFLLLIALLFPLFFKKNPAFILNFRNALSVFGILVAIILTIVYVKGNFSLERYFFLSNLSQSNVPDYLTLGEILGVLFFLNLSQKSLFWTVVKFWTILLIILLGGRGPAIFLLLLFVVNYLVKIKFSFVTSIKLLSAIILLPIVFSLFQSWSGSDLITQRFASLENGDKSLSKREELVNESMRLIGNNPLLGIGYGGFGIIVDGKDERYYPHNILLEIFVETGIIGILLLLLFFGYIFIKCLYRLYFYSNSGPIIDFVLAFIYVFTQSLKSSSIIDARLLIALSGIIIVAHLNLRNRNTNMLSV